MSVTTEFECKFCQSLLRVPVANAGMTAQCPSCQSFVEIPALKSDAIAPESGLVLQKESAPLISNDEPYLRNNPSNVEPDELTVNDDQEITSTDAAIGTPVVSSIPVEQMDFQPLDPNYISAERVGGLIFLGVVFVGAIIGLAFKLFAGDADWIFFLLAGVAFVILALLLWSAIWWPAIAYRHIRWKLDESGLEIHSGVWWKRQVAVPLARVQHADVTQGPLQRSYDIGTLTLHTAGTSNASVDLAGLNHRLALELRDQLIRQGKAGQHERA